MDPVSLTGLALGVASVAVEIYSGCIEGIQLIITAMNYPQDCAYLNLRLRMEQQRLFAWSETSGLLDLADKGAAAKIHSSNTFSMHRTTILDLLLQVQILFKEFGEHQRRHGGLRTAPDPSDGLCKPEVDSRAANFPLPERRRDYIKRVMSRLKARSDEGMARLRWVSFDKHAFETLLSRFASLNDAMMDVLDMQLQVEIRDTVQNTNRGVLQLHHRISDLGRLVMALNLRLETRNNASDVAAGEGGVGGPVRSPPVVGSMSEMSRQQRAANAENLEQLSKLARFKAFNASVNGEDPGGGQSPWDDATAQFLELARPGQGENLQLNREDIDLHLDATNDGNYDDDDYNDDDDDPDSPRCEAFLRTADGTRTRVWIEWKDYDDDQRPADQSPPKQVIFDRVSKLAALLNHTPKPEAFRTPHCIGFFDKASQFFRRGDNDSETLTSQVSASFSSDALDHRLGLVFARPSSPGLDDSLPPVSLRSLLLTSPKPSVTARVKLAHAVASCLVYLHAVNWLHKGLRSHNVVFFRGRNGRPIDFAAPYLSGFDFSRPARPDEETDMPGDDAEHNLYRHPLAQTSSAVSLVGLGRQISLRTAEARDINSNSNGNGNDATEPRQRFKKSFDIYGLGVLLFEIAHWATIDAVLGIDVARARARGRTSVALGVREQLLAPARVAEVAAAMGEMYADATRRCVEGSSRDDDDDVQDGSSSGHGGGSGPVTGLAGGFYEQVVKPLGGIKI